MVAGKAAALALAVLAKVEAPSLVHLDSASWLWCCKACDVVMYLRAAFGGARVVVAKAAS
jgi:hypothetical protein